jgi:hypothetical protein
VPSNKFGAIAYNYAGSSKGGRAEVLIDGVSKGIVSFAGSSSSSMAPTFGATQRYTGLPAGPHTIEIRGINGTMYVDGFTLESSYSNSPPAQAGPGQTSSTTSNLTLGQELAQAVSIAPGTQAISVVAETNNLPVKLVLLNPSGGIVQTATASNGIAALDAPVQSGAYLLKIVNLNLGPLQVQTLVTPYGAR